MAFTPEFGVHRIYKLTRDVANPGLDRRCKRGVNAIETFKAGTRITWYQGDKQRWVQLTDMDYGSLSFDVSEVLKNDLEPDTSDASRLDAAYLNHGFGHVSDTFWLKRLVERGTLTVDQALAELKVYADEMQDDWEEN